MDELAQQAIEALQQVAYELERNRQPTYKVRAFRDAAETLAKLAPGDLAERLQRGTLDSLPGIGKSTAAVITQAAQGQTPAYLQSIEKTRVPEVEGGQVLRAALRGDLHMHSNWSDGGSPIEEMARAARDLGHDYVALTDHSPRLTIAHGLSSARLLEQLEIVETLNEKLAPFRILTGIEVDILENGALDQTDELLAQLDVVVASVHSKLRMSRKEMTERMVVAIANPHTDILGHLTGRLVTGRGRPESDFDSAIVFEACKQFGVAVEINSRPERLDPPRRLLTEALETGCMFSIDTDAHAPGQLEWQIYGCARAEQCEVPADRVLNTKSVEDLLERVAN